MLLDLVDALRCTREHADSWLVATILERAGARVLEGTLGCPICYREYPIHGGTAFFGVDPAARQSIGESEPDAAMRAGALLAATEGATLVLTGEWGAAADELSALVPVRLYVVNPATPVAASERVAVIRSNQGIPLAPATARGVALGANTSARDIESALRALAPGGRLVAPVTIPVPAGVRELARDERYWVGETAPPLIPLRRG